MDIQFLIQAHIDKGKNILTGSLLGTSIIDYRQIMERKNRRSSNHADNSNAAAISFIAWIILIALREMYIFQKKK